MRLFGKNYAAFSDKELMQLITEKLSENAFNELYQRYSQKMLWFFYKMLNNDEPSAQDFLHDLFLKIIEKPELFDTNKKFSSWIFSVAHNMCKNEYRNQSTRKTIVKELNPEIILDESFSTMNKIDRNTFNQMLNEELAELDEEHRTTFLLRYEEELSIKKIGEILECAEGTVKSRLFYTTKKLASKLKIFQPLISKTY